MLEGVHLHKFNLRSPIQPTAPFDKENGCLVGLWNGSRSRLLDWIISELDFVGEIFYWDPALSESVKSPADNRLNLFLCLERQDAIKRSRASLMGSLFETIRSFLPEFRHQPGDLRGIWDPIDFISFNGLALNRDVDSITFVEVKTGRSTISSVERSIRNAIERGRVNFETVNGPPAKW